jgi:N-acyl-D-amino-acid deacylase
MAYDLLLTHCIVIDGTGARAFPADIGIRDGRIAAVGLLTGQEATQILDVHGLTVTPGFIDLHTHSDLSFHLDPLADSKVRQGVTLELVGNCGSSTCAPLLGEVKQLFQERLQAYNVPLTPDWTTFAEWLDRLEKTSSTVNLATQIGHGTVRTAVIGFEERAPTPQELEEMRRLVREALEAGAFGFSTGLFYAPGSYARTDEIMALAQEAGRQGKLYSSHIRDEGSYSVGLFHAFQEAIEIGRQAGVRVQVSHVKCGSPAQWGKAALLLEYLDRARDQGIDVAGDQYPYTAASTGLVGAIFPRWSQVGGREAFLKNVQDPSFVARLREAIHEHFQRIVTPDRVVIARFPPDPQLEGLSLAEIAQRRELDPADAAIALYREFPASVIVHKMVEPDVEVIARHPWIAVGSDGSSLRTQGPLSAGKPHPRNYGCFPRYLARYQREKGLVSLEEAVRKMTSLPASRLGLTRRGRIAPGYWADLVVFDPGAIRDTATFEDPHRYPEGIHHVLVNGVLAVADGQPTGQTPGRLLRRPDD